VLSAQDVISALKSSFHEYAPMAGRFKPSSPATIKLTHYPRVVRSFEVPQLAPPFLRWLRLGGLTLICFVAIGVWQQVPARAMTESYTAKNEVPLFLECVDVVNAAPNKDGSFTVLNSLYHIRVVSERNRSSDNEFTVGRDDRFDGGESRLLIKWPGVDTSDDWRLTPNLDIVSWGLAGVSKNDFDGNFRSVSGHRRTVDIGDIGTELPFAGSPHDANGGHQGDKLKERDDAGDNSDFVAQAPSINPILWSFGLCGLGFFVCLFGGKYFDNKRRLLGASIIGTGILLGALGILPWGLPL
jgi:hypothetical protein